VLGEEFNSKGNIHATVTLPGVWTKNTTARIAGVKLFLHQFGCVKHERVTN